MGVESVVQYVEIQRAAHVPKYAHEVLEGLVGVDQYMYEDVGVDMHVDELV